MTLRLFDYPLNLHISQTTDMAASAPRWFDYPLNLHISQTSSLRQPQESGLIIL